MPTLNFAIKTLDALKPPLSKQSEEYWDSSTPGFGLRMSKMDRKVWVVRYRVRGTGEMDRKTYSLVFNQLGIEYTSIDLKPKHRHLVVTGYNRKDEPVDFMQIGINNPAGGLKSNTLDLSKYLEAQMSDPKSKFQEALNIVHKNYHCLYKNGTYQQLAW